MKNRDYKEFAPSNYYHIFNRGVAKMNIFRDREDYFFFLRRLKENLFPEEAQQRTALLKEGRPLLYVRKLLPDGAFTLISYCLMPNHFHFLIKQNTDLPITKLVAKVCTGYSMYFNKKYKRVGGLLQSKFKAVLVDEDSYLLWLTAYIHNNPKVASLVKRGEDWLFSSYQDYLGIRPGKLCDQSIVQQIFKSPEDCRKFTEEAFEKIKARKDLEHLLLE